MAIQSCPLKLGKFRDETNTSTRLNTSLIIKCFTAQQQLTFCLFCPDLFKHRNQKYTVNSILNDTRKQ